jgi:rhodanese-related sulfurtransferase
MKISVLATSILFSLAALSLAETPAATAPVKIEQAEKKLAEGAQLLDVRTKEEWDEGDLKGAKLVTVTEDGFLEKAKAVLDPKKPVVVYCRSGKRSAMAVEQLRAAGFTVVDIEGGIIAWTAAGKPVEK